MKPVQLLSVCLLGALACATTKPAIAPALPVREDLPPEARELLSARMARHGDQMGALSLAVVLLDYEVVRLLASRMVDEPVLGRPRADDAKSVNALMPKSFFVHQDALSQATRGLLEAAQKSDDAQLALAYNEVARSCVNCHSAYLHDELTTELGLPCELDDQCDAEHEPASGPRDSDL